jgi:hypothetical protein
MFNCSEKDENLELSKATSFEIVNESVINLGVKLNLKDSTVYEQNDNFNDQFVLSENEKKEFYSSINEVKNQFKSIEIFDENFEVKYKNLDLYEFDSIENLISFNIYMPNPNSSEITKNKFSSINININEEGIYGFYPSLNPLSTQKFFNSNKDFSSYFNENIPNTYGEYDFAYNTNGKIIAYDNYVYSENTKIIKSNDEGKTWSTIIDIENGFDDDFLTCNFINENTGWLAFLNYHWTNADTKCKIYKYSNGNVSLISELLGFSIKKIHFINSNEGYLFANIAKGASNPHDPRGIVFFKSSNGGSNWGNKIEISANDDIEKVFVFNNQIIIYPSNYGLVNYFYKSEDKGLNWKKMDINISNNTVRDLIFINKDIGYLKTGDRNNWSESNLGYVYKTSNGGQTWDLVTMTKKLGSKIHFLNENLGYLQDLIHHKGESLLITENGGKTWKEILFPYDYIIK